MSKNATLSASEIEALDRIYREGGLRKMASPHVHYHEPQCPHSPCEQRMEWIDFQLELFGEPDGIDKPLVRAWWDGVGFAGKCPNCGGWIRFTTLRMEPLTAHEADQAPKLPDNWHTVAQFG